MKADEKSSFAVSGQTANCIEALYSVIDASEKIYDALQVNYGEVQGEEMYHEDFFPMLDAIKKKIGHYIVMSVEDFAADRVMI